MFDSGVPREVLSDDCPILPCLIPCLSNRLLVYQDGAAPLLHSDSSGLPPIRTFKITAGCHRGSMTTVSGEGKVKQWG